MATNASHRWPTSSRRATCSCAQARQSIPAASATSSTSVTGGGRARDAVSSGSSRRSRTNSLASLRSMRSHGQHRPRQQRVRLLRWRRPSSRRARRHRCQGRSPFQSLQSPRRPRLRDWMIDPLCQRNRIRILRRRPCRPPAILVNHHLALALLLQYPQVRMGRKKACMHTNRHRPSLDHLVPNLVAGRILRMQAYRTRATCVPMVPSHLVPSDIQRRSRAHLRSLSRLTIRRAMSHRRQADSPNNGSSLLCRLRGIRIGEILRSRLLCMFPHVPLAFTFRPSTILYHHLHHPHNTLPSP